MMEAASNIGYEKIAEKLKRIHTIHRINSSGVAIISKIGMRGYRAWAGNSGIARIVI